MHYLIQTQRFESSTEVLLESESDNGSNGRHKPLYLQFLCFFKFSFIYICLFFIIINIIICINNISLPDSKVVEWLAVSPNNKMVLTLLVCLHVLPRGVNSDTLVSCHSLKTYNDSTMAVGVSVRVAGVVSHYAVALQSWRICPRCTLPFTLCDLRLSLVGIWSSVPYSKMCGGESIISA